MSAAVGTVLFIALLASLGWWLGCAIAVWNTRPLSMYDTKLERWRAHSLLGTKWRTKRHKAPRLSQRDPLEQSLPKLRAWNDPLWPSLEHPPTKLDKTA